jgi:hypothetical protein
MEVRISVVGGDRQGGLESLDNWLREEAGLAGLVRVAGAEPRKGELGALADTLVVAVGSGGTLSVLATSLKVWLSHPRKSDIGIRLQGNDGRTIEIDAKRVDTDDIEALLRRILGDKVAEE